MADSNAIRFHEDPTLFREAINFTAAETSFLPTLIEKDYFCTILLARLAAMQTGMVFKGGTCLAKVYFGFHRLSEDLDFGISIPAAAKRKQRQVAAAAVKSALADAIKSSGCFRVTDALRGANNSTQYLGAIAYRSLLADRDETIKIEISLREPIVLPAITHPAQTVILNPLTRQAMVEPPQVICINGLEAMAEKFRAAMTRRDIAIRDYFDIAHAIRAGGPDFTKSDFIKLLRAKLSVTGNDPVDVGPMRMNQVRGQVETVLKPVLRPADLEGFELDRAIEAVTSLASKLATRS